MSKLREENLKEVIEVLERERDFIKCHPYNPEDGWKREKKAALTTAIQGLKELETLRQENKKLRQGDIHLAAWMDKVHELEQEIKWLKQPHDMPMMNKVELDLRKENERLRKENKGLADALNGDIVVKMPPVKTRKVIIKTTADGTQGMRRGV